MDPKNEAQRKAQEKLGWERTLLLYMHDLIYILALILILFSLVFRDVVVSGFSMFDTLTDGDYLILVSSLVSPKPERGDIIVVSKDSFDDGAPIVKRVIATEGQTVDIDFEAGIVYVDGVALEEPYTHTPTNLQEGTQFPLTVQEDCVIALGDNRNNSKDSRSPEIGQIHRREILGRAVLLAMPSVKPEETKRDFSRIGVIR